MEKKVKEPIVKRTSAEPEQSNPEQLTIADKIWNNIKDVKLEIFALPDQFVSNYCKPIMIDPAKLYLLTTVSSVLPALEEALKGKYSVERIDKYLVVS